MNKNWRNRPTTLDYIPTGIKWIIAIDESGNPNLNCVNCNEQHFTVTACAIKKDDFISSQDKVMSLKNRYWHNACFVHKGQEKRVCFHSREIRGRMEAFSPQLINYDMFIHDLSKLINELPITLYAANIDKLAHRRKYINPYNPYDLCMDFILERVMMQIPFDEDCIVVLESRGKKEDKLLLRKIITLLDNGNNFNTSNLFNKIKGVYFNSKWSKIDENKKSYWHLELADLCAYPIHKYLAFGTKDRAFETLEHKIYGYPYTLGRGLKNFP